MATTVTERDLMDYWSSDAVQTQPDYSDLASHGYATNGNPVTGVNATMPGASWFNMVSAMRVALIKAAGQNVDSTPNPLQFLHALQSLAWMKDKVIVTNMLADALITAAKLAANSVGTDKIVNSAVTKDKIAAGAVTFDRLNSAVIPSLEVALAGVANNLFMTPYLVKQMLDQYIGALFPTALYGFLDTEEVPSGWLLCNGAAVSRTTYANLFAKLGTKHGAGDGSTTFNLPNLNGRFLEGTTNVANVGKLIEAGLPNITGTVDGVFLLTSRKATGAFSSNRTQNNLGGFSTSGAGYGNFSLSAEDSNDIYSANTVQPSSIQALIMIKA